MNYKISLSNKRTRKNEINLPQSLDMYGDTKDETYYIVIKKRTYILEFAGDNN